MGIKAYVWVVRDYKEYTCVSVCSVCVCSFVPACMCVRERLAFVTKEGPL